MRGFRVWLVLCLLGFLRASRGLNEVEYEGNYADSYDNEISQDQQEGETTPPPCPAADFSRWDRLFIALEDSHMRQNMLLDSVGQCCGGFHSLRTQLDGLSKGVCQQCRPVLESACRAQADQASVRLQKGLLELQEEESERERRLNATLEQLLHSSHEGNMRLKRLEESSVLRGGPSGDNRARHQPTHRPGASGPTYDFGMKPYPSGTKEQEVTSLLDMATMEKALVSMATELQRIHVQLSQVIEQAGTERKNRGDT